MKNLEFSTYTFDISINELNIFCRSSSNLIFCIEPNVLKKLRTRTKPNYNTYLFKRTKI